MKFLIFTTIILVYGSNAICKALPCSVYTVTKEPNSTQVTCATMASASHAMDSLLVGSYNIHGIEDPESLLRDFEALLQIDVWALQEVYSKNINEPPIHLFSILPHGTWYVFYVAVNEVKNGFEGQAIVSRFPFSESQIIPLEKTGKKNRVALGVQIQSKNSFWIINTDHEIKLFDTGFSDRILQIQSLLRFTNTLSEPVVILGDFNTAGDLRPTHFQSSSEEIEETYKIFEANGFYWPAFIPSDEFTFENFFTKQFLDHIFFKGFESSGWNKFKERTGSDHFPVFTRLYL